MTSKKHDKINWFHLINKKLNKLLKHQYSKKILDKPNKVFQSKKTFLKRVFKILLKKNLIKI